MKFITLIQLLCLVGLTSCQTPKDTVLGKLDVYIEINNKIKKDLLSMDVKSDYVIISKGNLDSYSDEMDIMTSNLLQKEFQKKNLEKVLISRGNLIYVVLENIKFPNTTYSDLIFCPTEDNCNTKELYPKNAFIMEEEDVLSNWKYTEVTYSLAN